MDEELLKIKLPRGFIERALSLILLPLLVIGLSALFFTLTKFSPFGIVEWPVKIVGLEFLATVIGLSLLLVVWSLFTPAWIPKIIDGFMKHFLPLVLLMGLGALVVLVASLILAG